MVWAIAFGGFLLYNDRCCISGAPDGYEAKRWLRRREKGEGNKWKERAVRVAFPNQAWRRKHILWIAVISAVILPCSRAKANRAIGSAAERKAWCRRSDTAYMPYAHFAEIEVVLSESLTAAALAHLPKAPGSRVRVVEGGRRATAQLAATVVGDLIEQGHDVTVLRDFMLSQKVDANTKANDDGATEASSLQLQGGIANSSDADQPISEWEWVYSDISISGAPPKAVVTSVDVHFEIVHPDVEEVWVDLCNERRTRRRDLWLMLDRDGENLSETVTGITDFAGEEANQIWSLRATDVRMGQTGYIDSWWIKIYYEGPWNVGLHDDRNHPVVIEDGVPYSSATLGATGQTESSCGYRDTLDVWHSYTATQTGPVTINVTGDDFDTTLAVFDSHGVEQACGDDDCEGTNSVVVTPMVAGAEYLIRVAGYEYETGHYTLTVTPHAPVPVAKPDHPDPANGTDVDLLEIVLSWDDGLLSAEAIEADSHVGALHEARTRPPTTIYGADDRVEEYEVTDPSILAAGSATAVLIPRSNLVNLGDGTFQIDAESFAWWYRWLNPLDTGNALCDDEPFRDQPSAGMCTAVLVGPDLVATAGHCVECGRASSVAVVFDFVMEDALTPTMTLRADQVYWIDEVIDYHVGYPDWGLVRLDRKAADRTPLPLRRAGRISDDQRLLVIGHPWGIPRKYAAGATVRQNTEPTFFQANLDTYQGNSGSPVINLDSMEVEGILCRGMEEFVEDVASGCDRSAVCPDAGCPSGDAVEWEDVTRAITFSMMIPVYDVYLGTDPAALDLVAADLVVGHYRPRGLRKDTRYYWQVVARNAYGQGEGPVWSFRTALSPGYGSTLSLDRTEHISQMGEHPIGE